MKVFLTSAYPLDPIDNYTPTYLMESYQKDPFKIHYVVDSPDKADLIIFAEHHPTEDPFFLNMLKNRYYKKHKRKCYLYHDNYASLTFVPTITPTLEQKNHDPVFNGASSYLIHLSPNKYVTEPDLSIKKRFLFSFVGAGYTHSTRKRVLNLNYDNCYLLNTKNSWDQSEKERDEYEQNYARVCMESKFILCPRGVSPNSYRLYESMKLGIPPVIISDEWIPTDGPEWETFSIRIPEKDVENIPQILEQYEANASKMGELARQAWIDWFDKDKQFHWLVETCIRIHNLRNKRNVLAYLKQYMKLTRPFYAKGLYRFLKGKVVNRDA